MSKKNRVPWWRKARDKDVKDDRIDDKIDEGYPEQDRA